MIVLRLLLTGVLLYFAYGETGPWTTAVLFLIALANEANQSAIRHLTRGVQQALDALAEALKP